MTLIANLRRTADDPDANPAEAPTPTELPGLFLALCAELEGQHVLSGDEPSPAEAGTPAGAATEGGPAPSESAGTSQAGGAPSEPAANVPGTVAPGTAVQQPAGNPPVAPVDDPAAQLAADEAELTADRQRITALEAEIARLQAQLDANAGTAAGATGGIAVESPEGEPVAGIAVDPATAPADPAAEQAAGGPS